VLVYRARENTAGILGVRIRTEGALWNPDPISENLLYLAEPVARPYS
jgi:hypothetical protein